MTTIALKVIYNCDDVHVFWERDAAIPGCMGFAVSRKRNGMIGDSKSFCCASPD
jgi:hypothetical protein